MLYLIGLGLNEKGISQEGKDAISKCEKAYLESYTVDFPYSIKELEDSLGKKIIPLNREQVEKEEFLSEAKKSNICLLVYGSPLDATTHISLILSCKNKNIKCRLIHSASIFDAITETGLQLYKFGKTASMPKFQKNFEPDSFLRIIQENKKIKAHTLLLTDIGLNSREALEQLEKVCKKNDFSLGKIILCSCLGTKNKKIFYNNLDALKKINAKMPFCIIIPSNLHFIEEEAIENLKE